MKPHGPALLFAAWAVHDVEEALAFPSTCDALSKRTGFKSLRITARQSWIAVGIMGVVVGSACWRGHTTGGRSQIYRAVVAGLEGHVYTHLALSTSQRRYTAGVATALPIMLPAAVYARKELRQTRRPVQTRDYIRGALLLIPGTIISHIIARSMP